MIRAVPEIGYEKGITNVAIYQLNHPNERITYCKKFNGCDFGTGSIIEVNSNYAIVLGLNSDGTVLTSFGAKILECEKERIKIIDTFPFLEESKKILIDPECWPDCLMRSADENETWRLPCHRSIMSRVSSVFQNQLYQQDLELQEAKAVLNSDPNATVEQWKKLCNTDCTLRIPKEVTRDQAAKIINHVYFGEHLGLPVEMVISLGMINALENYEEFTVTQDNVGDVCAVVDPNTPRLCEKLETYYRELRTKKRKVK